MPAGIDEIYKSIRFDLDGVPFSKWPKLSCSAANELTLATPPIPEDPNPGDARLAIDGALKLKTGVAVNQFSSNGTLVGNSDLTVPTEKAVKTYIDAQISQVNSVIKQLTEKLEAVHKELQQKTIQIDRLNGELESTKRELQSTKTELENTKNTLTQTTMAAQETANTALSQAQSAQNLANSANSAAVSAQNTANISLSKASNLEGRTGDIESRIRHISVNPGNGNTHIHAGNRILAIQQDGNVVVYDHTGRPRWATGTN